MLAIESKSYDYTMKGSAILVMIATRDSMRRARMLVLVTDVLIHPSSA